MVTLMSIVYLQQNTLNIIVIGGSSQDGLMSLKAFMKMPHWVPMGCLESLETTLKELQHYSHL